MIVAESSCISTVSGNESFRMKHEINYTIINAPSPNRAWLGSFQHLKDVEFSYRAGSIDLILGVQYSHLHAESEVRQGLQFQLIYVTKKSRLGWNVIGPHSTKTKPANFISFTKKDYPGDFLGV